MRMAAGLPPDTVPIQHPVELGCSARERTPHNLTETEAGVPGRIPPGREKRAVSVEHDIAIIPPSVAQGSPVREILHGNL